MTSRAGRRAGDSETARYLRATARVEVALLFIAPLVVVHLIASRHVARAIQVSAERMVFGLGALPPPALLVLQGALLLVLAAAAWIVARERIPVHRYFLPFLLESLLFAALLGPIIALLCGGSLLGVHAPMQRAELLPVLVGSVGAGIYEEIVFRLVILGGLYALLSRALGLGTVASAITAILLSAVAFAAAHSMGSGAEAFRARAFVFRCLAGIVLGSTFVLRGLGVAVYLHAFYDMLFALRIELSSE